MQNEPKLRSNSKHRWPHHRCGRHKGGSSYNQKYLIKSCWRSSTLAEYFVGIVSTRWHRQQQTNTQQPKSEDDKTTFYVLFDGFVWVSVPSLLRFSTCIPRVNSDLWSKQIIFQRFFTLLNIAWDRRQHVHTPSSLSVFTRTITITDTKTNTHIDTNVQIFRGAPAWRACNKRIQKCSVARFCFRVVYDTTDRNIHTNTAWSTSLDVCAYCTMQAIGRWGLSRIPIPIFWSVQRWCG